MQPYAAPPPDAAAYAASRHSPGSREVTTDFAALGSLAAIELLVRQDAHGSAGTLIVAAGVLAAAPSARC